MPTLEATQVKCPECGATLSVAADTTAVTCEFCGKPSRIQRRTRVLKLPIPLPPPASHEPAAVARAHAGTGPVVLAIVLLTAVGIPLAVAGALVAKSLGAFDLPYWLGKPLLVADADGDGEADFIGIDRNRRKDQARLMACSGRDGHVLWESAPLGRYKDVSGKLMDVAGDAVLIADRQAHLEAIDLRTGKHRWTVTAAEVVSAVCPSSATGRALAATSDEKSWSVALSDGALAPSDDACPAHGSNDVRGGTRVAIRALTIPGMIVGDVFARGAGPRIALGSKAPGTPVPMIAALDGAGAVAWKSEVPGHDPLAAEARGVEHAAFSDRDVAVVYSRSGDAPTELTVFDRASGRRRFEVALSPGASRSSAVIALTANTVAVSSAGTLEVFDLADGRRRFALTQ